MNAISTFTFHENYNVRIITLDDGDFLFHANDLCAVLKYVNPHDAIRRHVEKDDLVKHEVADKLGRKQKNNFVLEAGMWSLILGSETQQAKIVKRWVTSEVLPTIRKTGKYEVPKPVAPSNYVTANDMENIKRLVWHCSDFMDYDETFSRAVWYALREKTGVKSPEAFKVEDLPLLGEEFERIIHIIEPYLCARREAERQLISRLVRGRGDYETIMKDILYLMRDSVEEQTKNTRKKIDGLFKRDFTALIERKTMTC